jgi:hypothetical protein
LTRARGRISPVTKPRRRRSRTSISSRDKPASSRRWIRATTSPPAIPLGANTFKFYGQTYTGTSQLFVSDNGLITFGTASNAFANKQLTIAPTQAAIAPLWDDWALDAGATDQVLYKFDTPNNRLIIEWSQVVNRGDFKPRSTTRRRRRSRRSSRSTPVRTTATSCSIIPTCKSARQARRSLTAAARPSASKRPRISRETQNSNRLLLFAV